MSTLQRHLHGGMPVFIQKQLVERFRTVTKGAMIMGLFGVFSFFFNLDPFQAIQNPVFDNWRIPLFATLAGVSAVNLLILRTQREIHTVIVLAVLFQVIVAFTISLLDAFWVYPDPYLPEPRAFWTNLWIVAYPIMVPLAPGITLLSSLACVGAVMVSMSLPLILGMPHSAPPVIYRMILETNLIMCVLAYIASRTVNKLNWQIVHERRKGSYELIRRLGAGAMGEVWLARHRMLHRPAAMKTIKPEKLAAADEKIRSEIVRRFEREAQATAGLYNPHSIRIYDFGMTEEGSFFIVMEALEGCDLDEFVKEYGPLPIPRAINWLKQICASLNEAHQVGLIHRDLKPANIHICKYGVEYDFIKVLDFGMVKYETDAQVVQQFSVNLEEGDEEPISGISSSSPGDLDSAELTQANRLTGTPSYMAPEMIYGEPVDHRYDIYALGCIAYFLITGTKVFQSSGFKNQLYGHMMLSPDAPSERIGSPVPTELEQLILDCLQKDPELRPATIADIIERLEALPVKPSWTPEDAAEWWQDQSDEARDIMKLASDSVPSLSDNQRFVKANSEPGIQSDAESIT
jgi:serine/threonine-protein kinase